MEFYSVVCEKFYEGRPTYYRNNQIIVLATDIVQAKQKLELCLKKLNDEGLDVITYKPIEEIKKCTGIMIADGFEGSTHHYGI